MYVVSCITRDSSDGLESNILHIQVASDWNSLELCLGTYILIILIMIIIAWMELDCYNIIG